MEIVERGWDDFWAEIFRVKHRRSIPGIQEYDELIVDFCIETLGLKSGDEILDIACGAGDQSIIFAKKGMKVSAFDIASSLIHAASKRAKEESLDIDFFTGDMREVEFTQRFKGIVILSHSFGFFNHEENQHVLKRAYESLVDGGKLLIDLMNPYNLPRFQKTWTKLEGGYLLSEPHVIDAPSGVLRGRPATFIDIEDGRVVLANEDALSNNDIRLYTALEIRTMLTETGFKNIEFYGQNKLPRMPYTATSGRMVVVATK
ncbi:MAG: class I SAM-dependent methyltransferase [Candidatus Thorarchaeota archaeon]|nr:class I SAM-dependent methyltransferase [Candidatus Thorarchaeota archaeon]